MSFQFTKLEVFPYVVAGKYALDWDGEGSGPVSFVVEHAPTETGPWTFLEEVNVKSGVMAVSQRNLSHTDDVWFRVGAKQNGKIVAYSSPTGFSFVIDRVDYLRYREMLRRWNLELEKFVGNKGKLLRLKTFGEVAQNVHPILGQPIGTEDREGFGTKFKGGYWPAIDMKVAYTDPTTTADTPQLKVEEVGLSEPEESAFFCMPFPIIKPKDVWVNMVSNSRHVVTKVETVDYANYRVKQLVNISRLPVTDPVYKVTL